MVEACIKKAEKEIYLYCLKMEPSEKMGILNPREIWTRKGRQKERWQKLAKPVMN